MRFFGWLSFGFGIAAWLFFGPAQKPKTVVLVFGGDTDGYLSPCGCTKPMSGGIRRRVSVIRLLAANKEAVILENGGFTAKPGRQSELKAEALAESLKFAGADAIHWTAADASLGKGVFLSVQNLTENRLVSGSVESPLNSDLLDYVSKGPFLITGLSPNATPIADSLGGKAIALDVATTRFLEAAKQQKKIPVVMLYGEQSEAESLAKKFPEIRLIQFRATGEPPQKPRKIGSTWLVTPGEKGKAVVKFEFDGKNFLNYAAIKLGPDIADDPSVLRAFQRYLGRVTQERLLEKLPRAEGPAFAGTEACSSCHSQAHEVWQSSAHAKALKTLEREGQDRDPDCVSCHVVGLEFQSGFQSRNQTPNLANVGCESCHGPLANHVAAPAENPPPKIGESSCMKCHVPAHSPGFRFSEYWPKIVHSMGKTVQKNR